MGQSKDNDALQLLTIVDSILTENKIWYSLACGTALGAVREKGFIPWDRDIDIMIRIDDQDRVRRVLRAVLPSKYDYIGCDIQSISGFDVIYVDGIPHNDLHVDIYPIVGGPDDVDNGCRFMRWCRLVHRVFGCKYIEYGRLQKKWKIPIVAVISLFEHLIPDNWFRKYCYSLFTRYSLEDAQFAFIVGNDGRREEYMKKDLVLKTKRTEFETLLLPVPEDSVRYLTLLYGDDYMTPKQY